MTSLRLQRYMNDKGKTTDVRRTIILLATLLTGIAVASGIALADTFTCTTSPCNGTEEADLITGTDPDPTTAATGNDAIDGLGGDDQIVALGGSDSVTGGAANDTMNGGMGQDFYRFADSFGADRIEADTSGVDTVDFSGMSTAPSTGIVNGITFDLEGPDSLCEPTSTNCLSLGGSFIENAVGTDFGDQLTGNASRNQLTGRAGDDQLNGGAGPDRLLGNNGTDRLNGGAGNDKLNGSPTTLPENLNSFYDHYLFTPNWGKDTITDSRGRGIIMPVPDGATALAMPDLTVNLVSDPSRPEVKDASGNTMNWENNDVKGASTGAGDDVISQRPMVSNHMSGGAGSDTYKGFTFDSFGSDGIGDSGGTADVLDLSIRSLASARLTTPKATSTSNVQGLMIDFHGGTFMCVEEGCDFVTIGRYFDNTSTDVCASGPGPGLIEKIKFVEDRRVGFGQVKRLVISTDRIDNDRDGLTDESGERCPDPT